MDCPPRFSTPRTPGRDTLGKYAANIAKALGMPLMPWQQHVLDVALEIDPETGRLAYRQVIVDTPRQSGKTTLILTLILLRAMGSEGQGIRYTAQTGNDARKKLMHDWMPSLQTSAFADFYKPRLQSGDESLLFHNGSRVALVAGTAKAGHGSTIDLAIVDETFSQPDARLEQALGPAMMTRPQPQFWLVSTAGPMDGTADYFWQKVSVGREAALEGINRGVAYFEWSAPDDADPSDPATWRACMPALGRTVSEDAVRGFFHTMELSEFRRAFLNQWTATRHDPVINLDAWQALISETPVDGSCALSFDVTPGGEWSSIAAAGRSDGRDHLDVLHHRRGSDWLPERLAGLLDERSVSAVVYDKSSAAAAAVAAEINNPRLRRKLIGATVPDYGQACQMLYSGVTDGVVSHTDVPEGGVPSAGEIRRA
jgi:phage terminase large subunit-like protein